MPMPRTMSESCSRGDWCSFRSPRPGAPFPGREHRVARVAERDNSLPSKNSQCY